MERWMDMIPCWEFELVSDFVNLPLDGELTYIAGTQLLAEQAEMQIPGGEPDLVPRVINRGVGATGIGKVLVPPHCLLEMDVS